MGNLSTTNRRQRTRNEYLSDRRQQTRIRNSFSDWFFTLEALQGSILRPLVFNIFLADLFLVLNDVDTSNLADDNTPFTTAHN